MFISFRILLIWRRSLLDEIGFRQLGPTRSSASVANRREMLIIFTDWTMHANFVPRLVVYDLHGGIGEATKPKRREWSAARFLCCPDWMPSTIARWVHALLHVGDAKNKQQGSGKYLAKSAALFWSLAVLFLTTDGDLEKQTEAALQMYKIVYRCKAVFFSPSEQWNLCELNDGTSYNHNAQQPSEMGNRKPACKKNHWT